MALVLALSDVREIELSPGVFYRSGGRRPCKDTIDSARMDYIAGRIDLDAFEARVAVIIGLVSDC